MKTSPSVYVNLKFKGSTFLILLAVMALRATAAGLPIEILDTRNATRLGMTIAVGASGTNYTQRQTSTFDIHDQIYSPKGVLLGQAAVGSFHLTAITTNMLHLFPVMAIYSSVTNEVWFSPVTSTTTTLEFERFMTGGHHQFDNFAQASLLNVTSGQEMLNHQWSGFDGKGTALIESVPLSFNAGDTYKLFMVVWTIEDTVGPWTVTTSSLRVSGFDPLSVPEPTTVSFLGLVAIVLALTRRCNQR